MTAVDLTNAICTYANATLAHFEAIRWTVLNVTNVERALEAASSVVSSR